MNNLLLFAFCMVVALLIITDEAIAQESSADSSLLPLTASDFGSSDMTILPFRRRRRGRGSRGRGRGGRIGRGRGLPGVLPPITFSAPSAGDSGSGEIAEGTTMVVKVYSKWSDWSPCTRQCRTRRYRVCEISEICGSSVIQEDAFCYVEGSPCEKFYKKKRNPEREDNNGEEGGNDISSSKAIAQQQSAQNETSKFIDDEKCGRPQVKDIANNLRIIGGREAIRGVWPWQVVILNHDLDPFCGSTLITPQFVLTAAHCVRRRLIVRAGEHDLMSEEGPEQQVRVEAVFKHPEYDPETVDNDIALLRLRKPLKLSKYVAPACLPPSGHELDVDKLGTILGWGKKRKNAHFGTDVLHQANVPIASIKDCRQVYNEYFISDNMLCAGYKRGRVDSCAGDSGGPLLFEDNGRWYIYGITSFGEGCGRRGKYGIYAKIANFSNWIRETIERRSKKTE